MSLLEPQLIYLIISHTLASDSLPQSFLLARKCKPSTKQSVFERNDLVCLQSKTQPGRTACSRQSLATRHCKIPAPACESQEFYRTDRKLKHHQRKLIFGSIAQTNGGRCSRQRHLQRCQHQISF